MTDGNPNEAQETPTEAHTCDGVGYWKSVAEALRVVLDETRAIVGSNPGDDLRTSARRLVDDWADCEEELKIARRDIDEATALLATIDRTQHRARALLDRYRPRPRCGRPAVDAFERHGACALDIDHPGSCTP